MKGDLKMKNTTRRVLILKKVNSENIEQAILILKNTAPDGDSAVIREAEKIVEKYMDKKTQKVMEEKRPARSLVLSLGVALMGVFALIIAFFA